MSNQETGADENKIADHAAIFTFFNEIGIINQLSSAMLQSHLPKGVTVAQFSVINHLIRVKDGQTPLKLASAFQVPKTSMTHSLAMLEQRGWIEMRENPDDKRSKQVWLTDEGRVFRDTAITSISKDMARLAPKLDFQEMVDVLPALVKVRQVLDADRD